MKQIFDDAHDSTGELTKYHKNYINRKLSHLQDDISKQATPAEVLASLYKLIHKLEGDRI